MEMNNKTKGKKGGKRGKWFEEDRKEWEFPTSKPGMDLYHMGEMSMPSELWFQPS